MVALTSSVTTVTYAGLKAEVEASTTTLPSVGIFRRQTPAVSRLDNLCVRNKRTLTAMALFGKLFGSGGKGEKAPNPQDAIQKLRETEDMLSKKQEFLEKKIEAELLTAKKNGTKNKRGTYYTLISDYDLIRYLNSRL